MDANLGQLLGAEIQQGRRGSGSGALQPACIFLKVVGVGVDNPSSPLACSTTRYKHDSRPVFH